MKNIKKVQQGARNSLIKYGLPANEKHHQEQPKFQPVSYTHLNSVMSFLSLHFLPL